MIAIVPVSTSGPVLNAMTYEMPTTVPGRA